MFSYLGTHFLGTLLCTPAVAGKLPPGLLLSVAGSAARLPLRGEDGVPGNSPGALVAVPQLGCLLLGMLERKAGFL